MICKSLRDYGIQRDLDVHLMTDQDKTDRMIEQFAEAGASYISIHPEGSKDISRSVHRIKSAGLRAGLVLNPKTSIDSCKHLFSQIDMLVLMAVEPGNAGQTFQRSVLQV
jgi:ribulose-phosphate 3-epimerase